MYSRLRVLLRGRPAFGPTPDPLLDALDLTPTGRASFFAHLRRASARRPVLQELVDRLAPLHDAG